MSFEDADRLDRSNLAGAVDAYVLAVHGAQMGGPMARLHAGPRIREVTERVLNALVARFDALGKIGAFAGTEYRDAAWCFAALDDGSIRVARDDSGIHFATEARPSFTIGQALRQESRVEQYFHGIAGSLTRLISDRRIAERPELRSAIVELRQHADALASATT